MDSYTLSRSWFNWCFENPELVSPNHAAIYFFAIEHCNRLGWKDKFGFPTQMAMDAIGIKKHQTYIKYFNDLCEWGFFLLVQKSSNQYSANIISLTSAKPKSGKALDKALIKHGAKQTETNGQSTGQSNSSIYKQETSNKEQETSLQVNRKDFLKVFNEVLNSPVWIDLVCKQQKKDGDFIKKNLVDFMNELQVKDDYHKGIKEIRNHFINWVKIKIEKEKEKKNGKSVSKVDSYIKTGNDILAKRGINPADYIKQPDNG